jgi:hypothetical protein
MPQPFSRRTFSAAALVLLLSLATSGSTAAGDVIAFVRSLYAYENFWIDVTADEATTRRYLDDNLAGLVLDNYANDNLESTLDYDPLLQAAEWDDVKMKFTVNAENARTASVTVAVESFGERIFVVLELAMTTDGWRLSDIIASGGASLVEQLKKLNAAS